MKTHLLLITTALLALLATAATEAHATPEDGFNPWTCDDPPPWDEERGAYVITVTGQRESGGEGGAGDAGGDGSEEPMEMDIGPELGDEVYPVIDDPQWDYTIGMTTVDTRTYEHAAEVVVLSGNGIAGGATAVAAAPFMFINFTYSSLINGELISQKMAQIAKIPSMQLRFATYQQLIRLMAQAEMAGKPIAAGMWSLVQAAARTAELLARFGPQSGLVSVGLLARATLVGTVLWGSLYAGNWVYNHSDWLQNGGLDDVFCGMSRTWNKQHICP